MGNFSSVRADESTLERREQRDGQLLFPTDLLGKQVFYALGWNGLSGRETGRVRFTERGRGIMSAPVTCWNGLLSPGQWKTNCCK